MLSLKFILLQFHSISVTGLLLDQHLTVVKLTWHCDTNWCEKTDMVTNNNDYNMEPEAGIGYYQHQLLHKMGCLMTSASSTAHSKHLQNHSNNTA